MRLSHITISGFKSFAKKTTIDVTHQVTGVVGPNGSGKSNVAEAIRFVLGEQSTKSMRGKISTDLLFKGSNHLSPVSRAVVTMSIDNTIKSAIDSTHISQDLAPYLVYDEIILSRVLYGDGTSDYTLNDAKVRLKDVQELLSFAGIGGSAHTIVSQGEADKILLASPKERKEALEDALGLRVYHMRLNESTRKLDKVRVHVHEVELLRKEITPHLHHLKRQVDKLESKEKERKTLHGLLLVYLSREERELLSIGEKIREAGTSSSLLLIADSIRKELEAVRDSYKGIVVPTHLHEKETLQAEIKMFYERRDQTTKTLGRLETEISYIQKELERSLEVRDVVIQHTDFSTQGKAISEGLKQVEQTLKAHDYTTATSHVHMTQGLVDVFFSQQKVSELDRRNDLEKELASLQANVAQSEIKEKELGQAIIQTQEKVDALRTDEAHTLISRHEEEKKKMVLESKLRELESVIALRKQEEKEVLLRNERFDSLLAEGMLIVGNEVMQYKDMHAHDSHTYDAYTRMPTEDLLRSIERSKLRIEEAGIPNAAEVIAEYTTTKEREEYLVKELTDIQDSEEKLVMLIKDLEETLQERFATGMKEVSSIFAKFFEEVFPKGKGKLSLIDMVRTDEEGNTVTEVGVDLDVSLPDKKVKEIQMFSGGERALTSIALLFAMSSLTPPPFMVLDETDAPLDEHNARKYGQMLARLAEKSKLLVITHNRETMNHCDMLYGVTIGADGASKLLSINFK
jgi:chromosome segregation protein